MQAIVALGSNLGDRLANLRMARAGLAEFSPLQASSIYETAPVGCEPNAANFFNAVVAFEFPGRALELLAKLRALEKKSGRPDERKRNASRELDLDFLAFGDEQLATKELQLPHPRLTLRRFVLTPLAEILPGLILPNESKTIRELLENLSDRSAVERAATQW